MVGLHSNSMAIGGIMRAFLLFIILFSFLITGCSHSFTLIPRHEGERGEGVAQEIDKSVTITLNGKAYTGKYVYGGGDLAFTNSFGNAFAYSGTSTATAFGSGFSTTYVPGSGNGRILAFSEDNDAIRCEFQYSSGGGLGICEDNEGQLYDLQIHN